MNTWKKASPTEPVLVDKSGENKARAALHNENPQRGHGPSFLTYLHINHLCTDKMLQLRIGRSATKLGIGGWRRYSSATGAMRYGFVGLGQMGYPMAMNLLKKTTPQSSLSIFDVNTSSLSRFMNEASTIHNAPRVTVASSPKDLAEQSVLTPHPPPLETHIANGE